MTLRAFGNMSQDEAREALGIPDEVVAQPVVDLGDLTYPGNASKLLSVKATEDGLEFRFLTSGDATAALGYTPTSITGLTGTQSASAIRTGLSLVPGTDIQAYDADLAAIAALVSAANKIPYATGVGTWALADFTSFGRSLVDDADAAAGRTTLGLGTAATQNTGTSGATVPMCNAGASITGDWNVSGLFGATQDTRNFYDPYDASFRGLFQSINGFRFQSNTPTTLFDLTTSVANFTVDIQRSGTKVVGTRKTGWSTATGTAARATYATYTSPTISNPPTQAEVQAIADHLQIISRTLKALIDDLHGTAGHGLIGT